MSVIAKIQSEVDVVLTAAGIGGMTLGELKRRLLAKQILLEEAKTKQGKIMGFRYQNDGGAWISASQIGSEYGLGLAARGVDFGEQSPTAPADQPDTDTSKNTLTSLSSQLAQLADSLESADPSAKPKPKSAKPAPSKPNSPGLPLRLSGHWHADVAIVCNQIGLALALALISYLKHRLAQEDIKMQVQVEEAFEERPWYVPLPKLGVKRLEITDLDGDQLDEERALQVDQIVAATIESVKTGGQNLPVTASTEAANLILEIEKEAVDNELDQIEEVQSKIRTSLPPGSEQEQTGTRSLLQILNLLLKKLLSIVQRQPVPQPYILGLNTSRIEIDSALSGRTAEEDHSDVLTKSMMHPKQVRDHYIANSHGQLKKFMAENPPISDGGSGGSRDIDGDDDEQEESYQPRM